MNLADLPAVTVDGEEYTAAYLSQIVSVTGVAEAEAARTPGLLFDLSRLVARAKRTLDTAQRDYRQWRDSEVHRLTNDVGAAIAAGFECAANPGVDAKGKPKPAKVPSVAAAEVYVRTLAAYRDHWDRQIQAEEAWAVLHGALQAANARTWCIREIQRDADPGAASMSVSGSSGGPPPPPRRRGR